MVVLAVLVPWSVGVLALGAGVIEGAGLRADAVVSEAEGVEGWLEGVDGALLDGVETLGAGVAMLGAVLESEDIERLLEAVLDAECVATLDEDFTCFGSAAASGGSLRTGLFSTTALFSIGAGAAAGISAAATMGAGAGVVTSVFATVVAGAAAT